MGGGASSAAPAADAGSAGAASSSGVSPSAAPPGMPMNPAAAAMGLGGMAQNMAMGGLNPAAAAAMAMGAFNPAAMGMGAGMGCGAAGLAMMFQQQQPKQNFSVNGMMNLPGMGMGVPVNSKKQRELYVGNLPPGVTEPMMKELFTQVLGACEGFDGSLGPTVLNVQLCGGGTYAFIEFRDEQCCESCMQFTGMVISGKPLKVHALPPFAPPCLPLTHAP